MPDATAGGSAAEPCRAYPLARGRRGRQPCARLHSFVAGPGSGSDRPTGTASATACPDDGIEGALIAPSAVALVVWTCSWLSPRGADATKDGRRNACTFFPRPSLLTTLASVTALPARLRRCSTTKGWRTCYQRVPRPEPKATRRALRGDARQPAVPIQPEGRDMMLRPSRNIIGIAPVSGEVMAAAAYVTIGLI